MSKADQILEKMLLEEMDELREIGEIIAAAGDFVARGGRYLARATEGGGFEMVASLPSDTGGLEICRLWVKDEAAMAEAIDALVMEASRVLGKVQ